MHSILAVIPCYNVERHCKDLIIKSLEFVSQIILVDDGSTDGTGPLLKKIQEEHPNINLITFPKNQGKGFAILAGFQEALKKTFDALVILDSDGQHDPAQIPLLTREIHKGCDLAIGTRTFSQMPWKNRISNHIISFLLHLLYANAPTDTQSGMRAFSRRFSEEVVKNVKGGRYETEFQILLLALQQRRKFASVLISTIYIEKNISSHFHVVRDSCLILCTFFSSFLRKK